MQIRLCLGWSQFGTNNTASSLKPEVLTWRVGGLSNWFFLGLISTITPIRVPFRVLISLLAIYLLSPPTLQAGFGNQMKLYAVFMTRKYLRLNTGMLWIRLHWRQLVWKGLTYMLES